MDVPSLYSSWGDRFEELVYAVTYGPWQLLTAEVTMLSRKEIECVYHRSLAYNVHILVVFQKQKGKKVIHKNCSY